MKCTVRLSVLVSMLSFSVMAQQGLTPEQLQQMQNALGALAGAAKQGGAKPVVDFRELRALLPKELSGFKLEEGYPKGQKSGAMGMTVSEAEARYEATKGDGSLSIKLSDISGTGAFGVMAHAAWASAEIDNEDDNGYEKTTTISGFKALEKYNSKDKDGEIQVIVDNRFVVEVHGNNVKIEQIKDALGTVDLKKLATLKPKAAAPVAK